MESGNATFFFFAIFSEFLTNADLNIKNIIGYYGIIYQILI